MAQQHTHPRRQAQSGVPAVAIVTATICCLPCICIIGGLGLATGIIMKISSWESPRTKLKKEKAEKKKEAKKRTPLVLGPRLKRHLTIGREMAPGEIESDIIDGKSKGERTTRPPARTKQQDRSPLFRLPLEVRRQIYEEAIGGYLIHTNYFETYKRFSHMRCKGLRCDGINCRQWMKQPGAKDEWGASDLMALLKTCRQIYSEAIEILYKENTFEFESLTHVLKFSLTILPERMQLIRKVEWGTFNAPWGNLDCNKTPWLECQLPHGCSCISCLPEQAYTDTNAHHWVTYTWLMRMVEVSPPAIIELEE